MNDKHAPRDGVPEDYPGRVTTFPEDATHLVVQLLGAEGPDAQDRAAFVEAALRLTRSVDGPQRVERGDYTAADGNPGALLMLYWTRADDAERWWQSALVERWWQALPLDGDTGFYTERMAIAPERFNYAAGTEDQHGSAGVLPLTSSATFGYWGAYRDRLPASKTDDFESPLDAVPAIEDKATRGQRLSVTAPDNLCFIREGQGWANCAPEEKSIWTEQMDPVVDEWVAQLGQDPAATGCLSIRDCAERDGTDGQAIERRTQIACLLSLGHIERAARTNPAHLAVHKAFVAMYSEPRFTPQMHVWVELGIVRAGDIMTEYVNCHPRCGLLPWFPVLSLR